MKAPAVLESEMGKQRLTSRIKVLGACCAPVRVPTAFGLMTACGGRVGI